MKKILLAAAFSLVGTLSFAQIEGKWKTIDDETGKPKSIVEIFKKKDGKYYGKINELLRLNNKEVTEEFESNIVSIYQDNLESLSFIGKQQVGQMVEEKLKKSKIPKTKFLWLKIDFLLKDEKKNRKTKKG